MTAPQPPLVITTAVILTGDQLRTALTAVLIAARARTINGLPPSRAYNDLGQALAAATHGQLAVPKPVEAETPKMRPTVPIEEAAPLLGLSRRQTRRLAPKLGGRLIAGRWLLDEQAVQEHLQGKAS